MVKKTVLTALCATVSCLLMAQESVTWTNILASGPSLPCIGKVEPKAPSQESLWSIGCECLDRGYGDFSSYSKYLHETGAGYARIQSGWQRTETKKGKYDFAWLDEIVSGLEKEGLKPWITLCYGNSLYSSGAELNSGIFSDEATMQAWCRYVKAAVSRYRGRVAAWEVWNEPKQVKEYINLLVRTSDVIRAEDPGTPVAGFSLTGGQVLRGEFLVPGLELLKSMGRLDAIDILTFHAYYEIPEWGMDAAEAVRGIVASYNPSITVCQGEAGCPSILEFAHAFAGREWSEYSQAKWILRRMAVDFSLSMPSNIFTFVDLTYRNPSSAENFANMQQHFGLLRCSIAGKVVYRKPAFHGVASMISMLGPAVHPVELPLHAYTDEEFYSVGLADSDGKPTGFMYWAGGSRPSDSLEMHNINISVEGFDICRPVLVDPLSGRIYDAAILTTREGRLGGKLRLRNVPVWDSPLFIMDADALGIGKIVRNTVVNTLE